MNNLNELGKKLNDKYKCALVTGGAGFIGSHICEQLLENTKMKVISIDNYSTGKEENIKHLKSNDRFVEVNGDVLDEKLLRELFSKYGIDLVFHNAASKKSVCLEDPRKDLDVNGKGTLNLLMVANDYKVKKFVHASTGSVYGRPQYFPHDENHPLVPASYYGVSKLAGEKYVMLYKDLYDMNVTVLRYFHVYGSRQESGELGGVVAIFARKLKEKQRPTIHGDGSQQRSFTYVLDVVAANFMVAIDDRANGEVYNCASSIKVTVKELYNYVFAGSGIEPIHKDWLIGDAKEFDVGNGKICKLGLEFNKDFRSMLKQML